MPSGEMPPEFIVQLIPGLSIPQTLARLDQIDTIVVVMMENRSFDHMLGYLRLASGPAYEGLTGHETNPLPGRTPIRVRLARDFVLPPVTRILNGPEHSFADVSAQIALGAMSGFAEDYENHFTGQGDTLAMNTGNANYPHSFWIAAVLSVDADPDFPWNRMEVEC